MSFRIGTAGWSIASHHAERFPGQGFVLERYAERFSCVEVNSCFYRPHRPTTWTRWASIVPPGFRFAVKMPRTITHERKLRDCGSLVARLLDETSGLGEKLAVLLVQLPPSLSYQSGVAEDFFLELTAATPARIVCEPRHASWFETAPGHLLARLEIARVAADPARVPAAAVPGGWRGLSYWRLHGSPVIYRSPYSAEQLDHYAALLAREHAAAEPPWCIFDNTAAAAATGDALALCERLSSLDGRAF
ncbi:DUF72 domain-containing protein [Sphingobium baderi]|uniref:DUF72 domain-containing protein n=1 Tax=Sphingobium baderi LL03 TaxID=1114964 RepID=T0GH61_9SPHN|nr:DUF72 domain-containing protein [Sphingobium baderi]EQB00017.1 hypothetical protein L485_13920 [Sphingobium baderi LL03]KMS61791.1 hypothetical protein V475_10720 [Sphingobium baderi LL03]